VDPVSFSQRKVLKALRAHGFSVVHEGGKHTIVQGEDGTEIAIPRHRELRRGTVRGIAEDANVDWEQFKTEIS
jgi:predicted RNA binding protein YcfA (HicA-like mRNA interferase family)